MNELEQNLNGSGLRIGIAQSRFNRNLTEDLLAECRSRLIEHQIMDDHITLATTPGVMETSLVLLHMAETEKYDALIALGSIVRGDTYQFEILANESARCLNEVQLACGIPVVNAILTTDTEEQAIARIHSKGKEAADIAIEMANLLRKI